MLNTNLCSMIAISAKVSALSCPWQLDYISKENNKEEKGMYKYLP